MTSQKLSSNLIFIHMKLSNPSVSNIISTDVNSISATGSSWLKRLQLQFLNGEYAFNELIRELSKNKTCFVVPENGIYCFTAVFVGRYIKGIGGANLNFGKFIIDIVPPATSDPLTGFSIYPPRIQAIYSQPFLSYTNTSQPYPNYLNGTISWQGFLQKNTTVSPIFFDVWSSGQSTKFDIENLKPSNLSLSDPNPNAGSSDIGWNQFTIQQIA